MKSRLMVRVLMTLFLSGCTVQSFLRENDERYSTAGALDSQLTGVYDAYEFNLMDGYRVSHQWLESGCRYRGLKQSPAASGRGIRLYRGQDIVEKDAKTWLRFDDMRLFDFDGWVRSVKWISQEKGKEGQLVEIGLKPVCFESWWKSSHYLRIRLQKRTLAEFEAVFEKEYPEGNWRSQSLNGLNWRVQSVPLAQLRSRPLNGVGGPYQSWLVGLGDTGYAMAIEMGASQESLAHPQVHAAIEGVLIHLVNSLKVDRLTP